jgi:hypothetical protein
MTAKVFPAMKVTEADLVGAVTFITTFILGLIVVPAIHELGHSAVCLIQGGAVTNWTFVFFSHHTPCTKPTAVAVAAGPLTSIGAWLLCTAVFNWQVGRLKMRYLFNFAVWLWLWWSFFFFHEQSSHAYYAYLAALPDDGGRFVQMTGLSPVLIGTTIVAVIVILLPLFFYVGAKTWRVWKRLCSQIL